MVGATAGITYGICDTNSNKIIENLQKQNTELSTSLEQEKTEKEKYYEALKESAKTLEAKQILIETLTSDKTKIQTDLSQALADIEVKNTLLESKQQELSDLNTNISTLQSELKLANNTIEALTSDKEILQNSITQKQSEVEALQNQLSNLESSSAEEKAQLESQITSLNLEIQNLNIELTQKTSELNSVLAEKEVIQNDLNTALAEKEELQESYNSLELEKNNLQAQIDKLTLENTSLRNIITELEEELAVYKSEEAPTPTSASYFTFEGDALTSYVGENLSEIVIPKTYSIDDSGNFIDGTDYEIKTIGSSTSGTSQIFNADTSIEKVTILDNIEKILSRPFYNCSKLKEVNFNYANNLKTINTGAFSKTSIETVDLSNTILTAFTGVFSNCTSLKNVILPETILSPLSNCFNGCTNITYNVEESNENLKYIGTKTNPYKCLITVADFGVDSLRINDNCEIIAESFFNKFPNLTEVVFPTKLKRCTSIFNGNTSLKTIDLSHCTNLTTFNMSSGTCTIENVYLPETIENINSGGGLNGMPNLNYTNDNGYLYLGNLENPYLYLVDATSEALQNPSFTVRADTKFIDFSVFTGTSTLTEVDFSNATSLEIIESSAFRETSITSIDLSACRNLKKIDFQSFGTETLKSIYIPSTVLEMEVRNTSQGPFYGCSSDLIINCELTEKPESWDAYWNSYDGENFLQVNWGVENNTEPGDTPKVDFDW